MSLEGNFGFLFQQIDKILSFSFPLFQYDISLYEILFFILILSFFSALFGINLIGNVDGYVEASKQPTRDAKIRANYERRQKMINDYRTKERMHRQAQRDNIPLKRK